MDIIPKTNFPDIRKVSMIQSAKGNLLTTPRERKLVRMYVQLPHKRSESKTSLQEILERCQNILSPYTLSFEYCDWWSTYGIGQRLADHFSVQDRIFLAGDAVRRSIISYYTITKRVKCSSSRFVALSVS
jgi:phenol 2-monooxygenase (NADPH)